MNTDLQAFIKISNIYKSQDYNELYDVLYHYILNRVV